MSDPTTEWLEYFHQNSIRNAQATEGPRLVPLAELGREPSESEEAADKVQDEPCADLSPESEEESRKRLLARLNEERPNRRNRKRLEEAHQADRAVLVREEARPREAVSAEDEPIDWQLPNHACEEEPRPSPNPFTAKDRKRVSARRGKYHTRGWWRKGLLAFAEGRLIMTKEQYHAFLAYGRSRGWNKSRPEQR